MKKKLDERELQKSGEIGKKSFGVMYFTCVFLILIQDLFFDTDFYTTIGEIIILMIGGLSYLVLTIKAGLWDAGATLKGIKGNLFYAIFCSSLFSLILWGLLIMNKPANGAAPEKVAGGFFIIIFIVCFSLLSLLEYFSNKNKRKNEQKYRDES